MFQVGDAIYVSKGLYEEFAIVEKITKTGRIRIIHLGKKSIDDPLNYDSGFESKTRVAPDFTKERGTSLIQSDGTFTEFHKKKQYKKYTDDLKLYDVWYDR